MFRTIQKQGFQRSWVVERSAGSGQPRRATSRRSAVTSVSNPVTDRAGFDRVRSHLEVAAAGINVG